jgi:electron transport complex protein RnfC
MALKTFNGGIHPHDFKELSKDKAIVEMEAPAEVIVPMAQHIGKPASCIVKVTDTVKKGQVIGEASGFVSANIHSPVSGKVKRLVECNTPTGMVSQAVLIENDGKDEWAESCNVERDISLLNGSDIRSIVQAAGIVGMGGATFPAHVKMSVPENKEIDAVILNGVECEPYLTADYRMMLETPETIVEGLKLVMKAVGCSKGYVGIEANKQDVYEIMNKICADKSEQGFELKAELLQVKYPQGAEKQLIKAVLDREVPSGGLPMDAGAVVQNVSTAHAVYEACKFNKPLIERVVTVTGEGVNDPKNLRARVGTQIKELLTLAGFDEEKTKKLICGGPMMGLAHFDTEMPVNKGMSGLLCLTDSSAFDYNNCIRCCRCVNACPQHLIPSELSQFIEVGRIDEAKDANLLDCIECGACTYICPARRPIVQWIKLAKYELNRERMRKAAKEQAENAAKKAEEKK